MSEYISVKNREFVGLRANYCCEYCRSPQRFSLFTFHIDHIISLKHGGTSKIINLAFACGFCNGNKGTDLGTFLHNQEQIIRFFNPRKDNWTEHFEMIEGVIYGKTDIGEVTVKLFKMNEIERILERKLLIEGGFISI
jgi:HNH endonuclease